MAHRERKPEPLSRFRGDIPSALAGVIERMMAKDPAQRYQRPFDVVEALAPWTATPIAPPPEEEMPKLSPALGGSPAGDLLLHVKVTVPEHPDEQRRKLYEELRKAAEGPAG